MIEEFLYSIFINQWAVLLIVSALLLLCAEGGFRLGRAASRRKPEAAEHHGGVIQGAVLGAVLGLLGLLLAFSFSMAVSRYEARRSLVIEEANSIGTTWLRADFLPAQQRQEVKDLLQRYARLRLDGFYAASDPAALGPLLKQVAEIHTSLWSYAAAAAAELPTPATVSFITSLNETIDLHTKRMAEGSNHIPGAVWLMLLIVAGAGAWSSGLNSGSFEGRSPFSQIVFPVLIAIVITLNADIDSPREGFIGLSQKPMEELLESMQAPAP